MRVGLFILLGVVVATLAIFLMRPSSAGESAETVGDEDAETATIATIRSTARARAKSPRRESAAEVVAGADDSPQGEVRNRAEISNFVAETISRLADADERTERDLLRDLRRLRRPTLLRALRGLVRDGNARERELALYAVAICFGASTSRERTVPVRGDGGKYDGEATDVDAEDLGIVSDGVKEEEDPEAREAMLAHDLVDCVGQALSDEEESVRISAYDTARSLNESESAVLSERILQGADPSLKRKLLTEVSPMASERDVLTLITAVENEDPDIAKRASERLTQASGEKIESEASALDWWERKGAEFLNKQQGQNKGD